MLVPLIVAMWSASASACPCRSWVADQTEGVEVRVGKIDLTPPELLPLGGYTARQGHPAEAGGDTLYARTVDLRAPGIEIAVVSVEMLTVPESFEKEVAKRLPPSVHLFLCATHTHSAPDSQMLNDHMTFGIPGIATFKPRWLKWYSDRVAEGILSTRTSHPMMPGRMGFLSWSADANRGRRKLANPVQNFTELTVNQTPLIGHFAAHATFYEEDENKTRGDWPGHLEAAGVALMLMGAIGDVSPKAPEHDRGSPANKISAFWQTILKVKPEIPSEPVGSWPGHREGQLAWLSEPIHLNPVKASPAFLQSYKTGEGLAALLVGKFAPSSAEISAWAVGRVAVVGVPGEPTSTLGREIEAAGRAQGWRKVLVVSHCNGWMGYILAPDDYDQGGYEATLSFYGREEGLEVVKAATRALDRLKKT